MRKLFRIALSIKKTKQKKKQQQQQQQQQLQQHRFPYYMEFDYFLCSENC